MPDNANQESGSLADAVLKFHGFRPKLQIAAFETNGWEYVADWSPQGGGCPFYSNSCKAVHVWRRPPSAENSGWIKALVCPRCRKAFTLIARFHLRNTKSRRERLSRLREEFGRWYGQLEREDLLEALRRRKITRLCHFTTLANLESIVSEGFIFSALELSSKNISFQASDRDRYDRRENCVSCSVEYPNLRYLSRLGYTRGDVRNSFEVVLLLNPELMTAGDVLFCQVNAAEAAGRRIRPGLAAFEDMFAAEVKTNPAYGQSRTIRRETLHPDSCPTYIQAEVLIPGPIEARDIGAVVVKRDDDGRAAKRSLKSSSTKGKPVHVIPDFFDLNAVQHEVFDNGRAIKISTSYGGNSRG